MPAFLLPHFHKQNLRVLFLCQQFEVILIVHPYWRCNGRLFRQYIQNCSYPLHRYFRPYTFFFPVFRLITSKILTATCHCHLYYCFLLPTPHSHLIFYAWIKSWSLGEVDSQTLIISARASLWEGLIGAQLLFFYSFLCQNCVLTLDRHLIAILKTLILRSRTKKTLHRY